MAARFVAGACPRDLDHTISLPVSRLLARVRLALAELRLMQARARDAHAAEDRSRKRPKYPQVPTGSAEDEAVVVEVSALPRCFLMQKDYESLSRNCPVALYCWWSWKFTRSPGLSSSRFIEGPS